MAGCTTCLSLKKLQQAFIMVKEFYKSAEADIIMFNKERKSTNLDKFGSRPNNASEKLFMLTRQEVTSHS